MIGQRVLFPVDIGAFEEGVVILEHPDGEVTVEMDDGDKWRGGEWQLSDCGSDCAS